MNTELPPRPTLNPAPMSDQLTPQERQWAGIAHASGFISLIGVPGIIGPLVVWLMKKEESLFVADQSKEAMNFHLTVLFAMLINIPLVFCAIGFFTIGVIWVASLVLTVIAAIKASNGENYRYPVTLRLIK